MKNALKLKPLWYGWIVVVFLLTACSGNKSELSNEAMLAGEEQKTWKATRETDSSGDKNKLTRDEKKERITFWKNGNVRMGDGSESMSGTWAIQGNNLSLVFAGSNVSENFTIVEIKEDEVKLKAGDGSQLNMKPE